MEATEVDRRARARHLLFAVAAWAARRRRDLVDGDFVRVEWLGRAQHAHLIARQARETGLFFFELVDDLSRLRDALVVVARPECVGGADANHRSLGALEVEPARGIADGRDHLLALALLRFRRLD